MNLLTKRTCVIRLLRGSIRRSSSSKCACIPASSSLDSDRSRRLLTQVRGIAAVLCLFATTACGSTESERAPFSIQLSATSDDGTPLEGVAFVSREKEVGKTPASGGFVVQLRGAEGSTLPLAAQCPDGYESPLPGSLKLKEVLDLSGKPEPLSFDATCVKQVRDVVVVVHAENGAGLPVTIDGQVSGTTDEHGNAHVLVPVEREVKSLTVSLDTTERSRLRPQNPRRVFELEGKDAVALFHQLFSEAKPPRRIRSASSPPRHVPYRVK